jgi:hypothetical protein
MYIRICLEKGIESAIIAILLGQIGENYFDYFIFNIVNYGFPRSGARHRALTQTIGNARGLDINSPRSAENHPQDLRFRRHQQRDDPNSIRGSTTASTSIVVVVLR